MYHILCFGDSNTYGYDGETGGRFDWEIRWTGQLARILGSEYRIIEEGLNGRTTGYAEPDRTYCNPIPYLAPCILSHLPLDLVIVMLGTNDTKTRFQASPEEIARSIRKLLLRIRNYVREKSPGCQVLLLSPVPLDNRVVAFFPDFDGESVKKSKQLSTVYRRTAVELGILFYDTEPLDLSLCADGCHLSPEGHDMLARHLGNYIKKKLY